MIIIDAMAAEMKKYPQLKKTNVSEQFKGVGYSTLQLPGELATKVIVDNVDNIDKTLNEFEQNMLGAVANGKSDTKKEEATSESNVNGNSTTENKDAERPSPKNGDNEDTSQSNKKPEDVNVNATLIESKANQAEKPNPQIGNEVKTGALNSSNSKPEDVKVEAPTNSNNSN